MKFYIATKLENHKQHNIVRDILVNEYKYQITYDWTVHGPVWSKGVSEIKRVQQLEINGVKDADVVIVLSNCPDKNIPTGRGTHVELGLAIAYEKDIYIVGNRKIISEAHTDTCAFWHNDLVNAFETYESAIYHIYRKYGPGEYRMK